MTDKQSTMASARNIVRWISGFIGEDISSSGVQELAAVFPAQRLSDLLQFIQLVRDGVDPYLFQKFEIILNLYQECLHLTISTEEYRSYNPPYPLAVVVAIFWTGFAKVLLQMAECLLALLQEWLSSPACVWSDLAVLEALVCVFQQLFDGRYLLKQVL